MLVDEPRDGPDYPVHSTERPRLIPWIPVLGVAFLVLELNLDPVFAVLVVCLKVGWADMRTAWWVRRSDPDPIRGRTCSGFFAASGMLKIAGATLLVYIVLFIAIITVSIRHQKDIGLPPKAFFASAALLMLLVPLTLVTTWAAVLSAWRSGIRVWADSRAKFSRKSRSWPPYEPLRRGPRGNLARLVLRYAILAPTFIGVLVIWAGLADFMDRARRAGGGLELPTYGCMILLTAPVVLYFGVRALLTRLGRLVVADSPQECYSFGWGDDTMAWRDEGAAT